MSSTASQQQEVLGRGFSGIVARPAGADYVQKRLHERHIHSHDGTERENFLNQKKILQQLETSCPYILGLHHSQQESPYRIKLQGLFDPWKDLFALLFESGLESDELNPILREVLPKLVDAVECLHQHGIAHRDIKIENIMINPVTMDLRLIDFGFARKEGTSILKGTAAYIAPDMFGPEKTPVFTMEQLKQFDLWSLGITIYLCIHRGFPRELYRPRKITPTDNVKDIRRIWKSYGSPEMQGINIFSSPESEQSIEDERTEFLAKVKVEDRERINYLNYLKHNEFNGMNRTIPPKNVGGGSGGSDATAAQQQIIGQGISGDVVRIKGRKYVQKRLFPKHIHLPEGLPYREAFKEQKQILRKLDQIKCPYILHLHHQQHQEQSSVDQFKIKLQGLFNPWTDLLKLILEKTTLGPSFLYPMLRSILPKLVDAVECLHRHDIVHRDIKPENIMINPETLDLRLIDFGFATDKITDQRPATKEYIAPDMIATPKRTVFTMEQLKQFDLWSLGMTIFVSIHHVNPLQELSVNDIIEYYNTPNMPYITYFRNGDIQKQFTDRNKEFLQIVAKKNKQRVDYRTYLKYNAPGELNRHIPPPHKQRHVSRQHSSTLPTIVQE